MALIALRYVAPKSLSEKAAKRAALKKAEEAGFTNISADQTRPFSAGLSVYLTAEHPEPKGAACILQDDAEPYWIGKNALNEARFYLASTGLDEEVAESVTLHSMVQAARVD